MILQGFFVCGSTSVSGYHGCEDSVIFCGWLTGYLLEFYCDFG